MRLRHKQSLGSRSDGRAKLLRPLARRDVRVVEGARLESVCRGNSTVGSNPTLSATPRFHVFVSIFVKSVESRILSANSHVYHELRSNSASSLARHRSSAISAWHSPPTRGSWRLRRAYCRQYQREHPAAGDHYSFVSEGGHASAVHRGCSGRTRLCDPVSARHARPSAG